jgi:hypothetical protein
MRDPHGEPSSFARFTTSPHMISRDEVASMNGGVDETPF